MVAGTFVTGNKLFLQNIAARVLSRGIISIFNNKKHEINTRKKDDIVSCKGRSQKFGLSEFGLSEFINIKLKLIRSQYSLVKKDIRKLTEIAKKYY